MGAQAASLKTPAVARYVFHMEDNIIDLCLRLDAGKLDHYSPLVEVLVGACPATGDVDVAIMLCMKIERPPNDR